MTKAEIVDNVYERVGGFSKKEAAEVVEAVFDTMKDAMETEAAEIDYATVMEAAEAIQRAEETRSKEDAKRATEMRARIVRTAVKISGFGNFVVRGKPRRQGRNPQTDQPIPISARRVVSFKPSQVLKSLLNPHKVEAVRSPRSGGSGAPTKRGRPAPRVPPGPEAQPDVRAAGEPDAEEGSASPRSLAAAGSIPGTATSSASDAPGRGVELPAGPVGERRSAERGPGGAPDGGSDGDVHQR